MHIERLEGDTFIWSIIVQGGNDMQIFRNLKPYWKSVIIIALLLVLQAYCDLSLPDYTSKLIDTGMGEIL